jgi:3-dehydroquinate synthase
VNPNIVLTGMMGTGKSTVGMELARLTGLLFVDADTVIEKRLGMAIPEIFRRLGEARFREEEKRLAGELCRLRNCVIATGGGMVLDPRSRKALEKSGHLVCLMAEPRTIARRVGVGSPPPRPSHGHSRPLLEGSDGLSRIEQLLASRERVYRSVRHVVETDGISPVQVARMIMGALAPCTRRIDVEIPGGRTYPVFIGRGILEELPQYLSSLGTRREVFVVTDSNVYSLHGRRLVKILRTSGYRPEVFSFPAGEERKKMETVGAVHSFLASNGAQRDSLLLAFGGGVTGDLAGFAASTYMRGISVVHVPTTLMAQVDSSIGGKTAVNMRHAKNLIGTFHHPRMVLADPELLSTLPLREIRCGIAEILKTAIIDGEDAFLALETLLEDALRKDPAALESLIFRCAGKKARIVSRDPFEEGERRVLNLGHTFAHAIEKAGGYSKVTHGEAVAVGLGIAVSVSLRLGKISRREAGRIVGLIERAGLRSRAPRFAQRELLEAALLDKKARKGKLTLVLPARIGKIEIVENVEPRILGRIVGGMYAEDPRDTRAKHEKAR